MKYEKEYHSFFHKNLLKNNSYYLFRAKYADKIYWKYFENKNKKILEFGCGLGQNSYLHKENTLCIDISQFCKEECEKRGIKVIKDISKIKKDSFDGILSVHTLEHLEEPLKAIKEFYRVLKPRSRLVLVLPYEKNVPIRNFKPTKAKHLYNWTFKSINELLYDQGFKIKLNKFNYAKGYSIFYKYPLEIALRLIKLLGLITNSKEMIVVAEK